MNDETDFGYKVRQILNDGVDHLDGDTAGRLARVRHAALDHQTVRVGRLRLAGFGNSIEHSLLPWLRSGVAVLALLLGAVGTYYWNAFQDAQEYEEIDSALLADELPPSAYLDRGFHAWLEHASLTSSQ
jgi:anionic cell wall polymer biosynthesis LytR-Cps2A-Psr (LCP) family protein